MIVCSCNALREREVREAVKGGAGSAREAYHSLGCRPQCGRCIPYARQLVQEEATKIES